MILLVASATGSALAEEVEIGGIVISISDSWTAQVFHVVDQLSEWDEACHRQYGRWADRALNLDRQDSELLQKHAKLRRARGWGKGFEQAFYVDGSIEVAASKAVDAKVLASEEAATERAILLHFAPKLSALRSQGSAGIARFRARLAAEGKRITPFVQKLVRFAETEKPGEGAAFPGPESGGRKRRRWFQRGAAHAGDTRAARSASHASA